MDPVRLSKERLEKIRKRIERIWVVSWTDARALLTEIVALQAEQAAAVQQIVALQVERAQATETIEALTVGLDLHRRRAAQRAAESTQLRIALDEMNDQ